MALTALLDPHHPSHPHDRVLNHNGSRLTQEELRLHLFSIRHPPHPNAATMMHQRTDRKRHPQLHLATQPTTLPQAQEISRDDARLRTGSPEILMPHCSPCLAHRDALLPKTSVHWTPLGRLEDAKGTGEQCRQCGDESYEAPDA